MKRHSVVGGVAAILTMLVRSRLKWCVDLSTYGFEGFEAKIQGQQIFGELSSSPFRA